MSGAVGSVAAGAQAAGIVAVSSPAPVPASIKRILHVTADFPDPVDAFKTTVVRTLVELTKDRFRHEVISLNRRSPAPLAFAGSLLAEAGQPELPVKCEPFAHGRAVVYKAPPLGLFHATMLRALGDWLARDQAQTDLPDLIVGHKLTIEGIAVRRAAKLLGVPFALCIQGDTDTKVLAARPDLRAEFDRVFKEAAVVFPFTPWALAEYERRFGPRSGPTIMLPCPTDLDTPLPPSIGGDGLVSVFHLKNHRRKNLNGMVAALRLLKAENAAPGLEIIGGGTEEQIARCRQVAAGVPNVAFEGPLDRHALRERLNRASAFLLPSLRESFGLVFIEALFAGLPVIYPKGTAINGYFEGAPFAIGVDARNPREIGEAVKTVMREEAALKAALRGWQISPAAECFMRGPIGDAFASGLARAVQTRAEHAA